MTSKLLSLQLKSYANALEEGLVKTEDLKECYRIIDKKAVRVDVLVNEMFPAAETG